MKLTEDEIHRRLNERKQYESRDTDSQMCEETGQKKSIRS